MAQGKGKKEYDMVGGPKEEPKEKSKLNPTKSKEVYISLHSPYALTTSYYFTQTVAIPEETFQKYSDYEVLLV